MVNHPHSLSILHTPLLFVTKKCEKKIMENRDKQSSSLFQFPCFTDVARVGTANDSTCQNMGMISRWLPTQPFRQSTKILYERHCEMENLKRLTFKLG